MSRRIWDHACLALALAALFVAASDRAPAQTTEAAPSAQSVSQTGLLPVYGVDLAIDPAWVDSAKFPGDSTAFPNSGTSAAFQTIWDAMKACGLNSVRFGVDVRKPESAAAMTANLCVWAKAAGAYLLPVLTASDAGKAPDEGFAKDVAEYVKLLNKHLASDNAAYKQILAFQIENCLNHPGLHGKIKAEEAAKTVLAAAASLRTAEQEALKAVTTEVSPIMADASFDAELIRAKAMAGSTLTDVAFDEAYGSLKSFVSSLAASQDVDVIGVQWLPGSVGAGSAEKLPALLQKLKDDCPGKQIVLSTGYSTAFNPPADQKQFYTAAFANLADFRAREATAGAFLGVMFKQAANSAGPEPTPPSTDTTAVANWDRTAKAQELLAMWEGGTESADMKWWFARTESSFGLFAVTTQDGQVSLAPQPAQEALVQIASAVTEANTAAAAAPAATETPSGTATSTEATTSPTGAETTAPTITVTGPGGQSFGAAVKGKLQEGLLGLLDKVFQKIGDKVMAAGTGTSGSGYSYPTTSTSTYPSTTTYATTSTVPAGSLTITGVNVNPAAPQVGQPITCSVGLQYSGTDQLQGLTVALVNAQGYMFDAASQQTGVSIGSAASKTVDIVWTPAEAASLSGLATVYDSAMAQVTSSPVSITVAGGTGGSGGGTPAATTALQCSAADVSFVPAAPQAAAPAKVKVKVKNTGGAEVAAVDLLLVDTEAPVAQAVLAELDGSSFAPGEKTLDLDWTPASARTYNLSVQLWKGYESMYTEAKLPVLAVGSGGGGTPGGGQAAAGSFTVDAVTVTPAKPAVGQTAKLKVDVTNGTASAVSTLDVYLVDPANPSASLGSASLSSVAAGTAGAASVDWLADVEGTRSLQVQVWDPSSMLGSKNVDIVVASAGSSGGQPGGQSGGGKTIIPGGKRIGSKLPGKIPPPKPNLTPILVHANLPLGLPLVQELALGGEQMKPMSGKTSMSFSLQNPYDLPIQELMMSLSLDGKGITTKSMGVLLAKQNRTMEFADLVLPDAGMHTYSLKISGGPGGKLNGSVDAQFEISPRMIAGVTGKGVQSLRPSLSVAPLGVRAMVPPAFKIGSQVLTARPPMRSELIAATVPTIAMPGGTTLKTGSTATPRVKTTTLPSGTESASTTTTKPKATVRPTIPGVSSTSTATTVTKATIPGVTTTTTAPTGTLSTARPTIPGVTSTAPATAATGTTVRPTIPVIKPTLPTTTTGTTTPSTSASTATTATIPGITRPAGATGTVVTPTITPSTSTIKPTVPTVPTVAAPTAATTSATVATAQPPGAAASTATQTPSLRTPPLSTATLQSRIGQCDLSVDPSCIQPTPIAPRVGDTISIRVTVRNLSVNAAKGAKVVCALVVNGVRGAEKEFTVDVPANGMTPVVWSATVPRAKVLAVDVVVSHTQDSTATNNRASAGVALAR